MRNWCIARGRITKPRCCRSWIWAKPEKVWCCDECAIGHQIVSGQRREGRPLRARSDHLLQSDGGARSGQGAAAMAAHPPDFPLHEALRRKAELAFPSDVHARIAVARA